MSSGSKMSITNLFILASVHIKCVCFGHDYLVLVNSDARGQEKYDDWIVSFQNMNRLAVYMSNWVNETSDYVEIQAFIKDYTPFQVYSYC